MIFNLLYIIFIILYFNKFYHIFLQLLYHDAINLARNFYHRPGKNIICLILVHFPFSPKLELRLKVYCTPNNDYIHKIL